MGYGDAAFASYYPSSSRCFGFHDPDIFDLKKPPTYEVIGWRKEKDDNLINWIVNNSISGKRFNTDELISKSFGWHLGHANPGNKSTIQSNPSDVVVCYSRIKIGPGDSKPGKLTNHQVSLGSNANDALAAYLTKQTLNNGKSVLKKSQIEEQLDYLSAINAIANKKSDKYYKLLETRHEQSYVAESGGISWALRNEPNKETANAVNTGNRLAQEYPAELGKLLGKANELQKEYQTAQYSIIDLQTQIFFDWHRYQFAMYPQGTENRIHANVDEIKHFIQNVSIKKLHEMQRDTGEINYRFTENQTLLKAKASTGTKANTAQTLATALNQLTKKLSIYNHCFISGKIHGDITLEQDSTIGGIFVLEMPILLSKWII
ncbi:hypothetical protein AU255_06885 [Methyloprofundus sedimenti]|uniref:Uncharacterized protein n=1 Tax=Methyloprofundus sedimenti TaxID=1420851 RepID=A0A1V8M7P2_9GAMM|nr:hypothetical protein [Methyloprofundus sedimenti]OQK17590.1 hypothetical protein AU255_06885 [Methyloprofundus sedimenti]